MGGGSSIEGRQGRRRRRPDRDRVTRAEGPASPAPGEPTACRNFKTFYTDRRSVGRRRSVLGAALGGSSDTRTRGRLVSALAPAPAQQPKCFRQRLRRLLDASGAFGASAAPPAPFRRLRRRFFSFFPSFSLFFSLFLVSASMKKVPFFL